jgi:hypothetical protein
MIKNLVSYVCLTVLLSAFGAFAAEVPADPKKVDPVDAAAPVDAVAPVDPKKGAEVPAK